MKRSEMSCDERERAREKARERYVQRGQSQARRCYLRHLQAKRIANPRPATLIKWGLEDWAEDTAAPVDEKRSCAIP